MVENKYAIDWLFENLDTPLFSQADALALGDGLLKKDTFQNWANRGLIESKMVRGKRLLTPLGLAQLIFAQIFIRDLEVTSAAAGLMVTSCLLVFQREQRKHPVKSINALLVFSDPVNIPRLVYRGTDLDRIFEKPKPHIVMPFGKMLNSLATAAQSRIGAA